MTQDDSWIKRDAKSERTRRENVRRMRNREVAFMLDLFFQIRDDLEAFETEFPDQKGVVTVDEKSHHINRKLISRDSISVNIRLDFEHWKLIWVYSGCGHGTQETPVSPVGNSGVDVRFNGAVIKLDFLSEQLLRPILFPELTEVEGDPHGPSQG